MSKGAYVGIGIVGAVVVVFGLCCVGGIVAIAMFGSAYGKKIERPGGELYYTKNVDADEANKMADFLAENYFKKDGDKVVTVQLDREGDTPVVRMVYDMSQADKFKMVLKLFQLKISRTLYDGNPVILHLCDNKLKTQKVIEWTQDSSGKKGDSNKKGSSDKNKDKKGGLSDAFKQNK